MLSKISLVSSDLKDSSVSEESLSNIGKDVIKYAPSKVIGMLINLSLVPIYTNLLNPEQYGLYNIAVSVLSFICIIFSDWVGMAGLRFFKEHHLNNDIKGYFSTLTFLLASNLVIMYILSYIFFKPISNFFNVPHEILYLVLLLIIPVAVRALLFQVLRAQIKPLSYTLSVIINQILTVVFAVFFIKKFNLGVNAIILGMSLSIALIDLFMIPLCRMKSCVVIKEINFSSLINFYKYGLPLAASSLGVWLFTQNNKFILQHYKGSFYNGIYGVGFNLTYSTLLPLFSIVTLAAVPRIISQYELGTKVRPIITKLTGYYFKLFAPVVLIFCLFPKDLVILFSNSKYREAYMILPCLALSVFFFGLTEYTTIQYHLCRKTYLETISRIIPGIVEIVLNIILIPKLGWKVVGFTILFSSILYFILSLCIRIKDLNWIPPFKDIKKCLLAIIVCILLFMITRGIFVQVSPFNFVIQLIMIITVYYGVLQIQKWNVKLN